MLVSCVSTFNKHACSINSDRGTRIPTDEICLLQLAL